MLVVHRSMWMSINLLLMKCVSIGSGDGVSSSRGKAIINTLRPRQNGRHLANDTIIRIFLNENIRISIKISLKFVPKGPINNIPALVQIMAWRRSGDKPLSEPMVVSLLTHICVTRPQWVNRWLFVMRCVFIIYCRYILVYGYNHDNTAWNKLT